MIDELNYVELNKSHVSKSVLKQFDCGNNDLTNYLIKDAYTDCKDGNGVTYILINKNEYENGNIKFIYAYTTIRAHALNYYENAGKYHTDKADKNGNVLSCISSVEIKLFAIDKAFKHQKPWDKDNYYSTIFFKLLLEKLYYMSMDTIDYKIIFLRANEEGENLYRRVKFDDCTEYIVTYDESAERCKPLFLSLKKLEYVLYT